MPERASARVGRSVRPAPDWRVQGSQACSGGALLILAVAFSAALCSISAAHSLALCAPAVPFLGELGRKFLRNPGRWFLGFAAASLLLPPLPLPIGDSGPHLAIVFAAAGLWIGARRPKQWRLPMNLLTGSALALVGAMSLSVLCALYYSGPRIAAGSAVRVALFGISLYSLFYFSYGPGSLDREDSLRWAKWIYWMGIASALFACIDFYFQFPPPAGYGEQFVWLRSGNYRRAQGLFYEAGVLGNLCSFFLVMMALAWVRPALAGGSFSRSSLALGGLIFPAALLFSFSRASFLNAAAALIALAVLCRKQLRFRRILPVLIIVSVGGLVLTYILFPSFVETYLMRMIYSALDFGHKPDTVLGGRVTTWTVIFTALAENPSKLLFGVGFKTLAYGGLTGRPLIADNMYISMLAETGIFGLAAMLSFQAALLKSSYCAATSAEREGPVEAESAGQVLRSTSASFLGAWFFCFWIGQLVQMLSVDTLTYWRVLPIYLGILGLALREHGRYDRVGSGSA